MPPKEEEKKDGGSKPLIHSVHLSDEEVNQEQVPYNSNRYLQLATGIVVASLGATTWAFGLISKEMKEENNLNQGQMTTISTVATIVGMFGLPAGIIFDLVGPRYVLLVTACGSGTGFIVLALFFSRVCRPTVATFAVASALMTSGAGYADTGGTMTNMFNFPLTSGYVVILGKTMNGLGSTFFSTIFNGFFSITDNYVGYCIFMAAYVILAGLLGAWLIRLPAYHPTQWHKSQVKKASAEEQAADEEESARAFSMANDTRLNDTKRAHYGLTMLWITLIYYALVSILYAFLTIPFPVRVVLGVIAIVCVALFFVMAVPRELPAFMEFNFLPSLSTEEDEVMAEAKAIVDQSKSSSASSGDYGTVKDGKTRRPSKQPKTPQSHRRSSEAPLETHQQQQHPQHAPHDDGAYAAQKAARMVQTSLLRSFLSPILWCFLFETFAVMGMGCVFSNNTAQIYDAVSEIKNPAAASSMNSFNVALIGIGSALGRVIIGYGEILVNEYERKQHLLYSELVEAVHRDEVQHDAIADYLVPPHHRWLSSITVALPLPPLLMGLAALFTLILPGSASPLAFLLAGFGTGTSTAVVILATNEIYAVQPAMHYKACNLSPMVSTIVLNSIMFGRLYDVEGTMQAEANAEKGLPADPDICTGLICVRTTMIVGVILNAVAVLTGMFLMYTWRKHRMDADAEIEGESKPDEEEQKQVESK